MATQITERFETITEPTCRVCLEILDEDRDSIGTCADCEAEENREEALQDAWNEYSALRSARHSQYDSMNPNCTCPVCWG